MATGTRSPIADYLNRVERALGVASRAEGLGSIALVDPGEGGTNWPSIADFANASLNYDDFKRHAHEAWETLFHFASALTYARVGANQDPTEQIPLLEKLDASFPANNGPIDVLAFNDYIEESLRQLQSHQVRYALLAVEVYVELLWLLREVGVCNGVCVPVCAGRNANSSGARLVEFVTMHFHRCAVKLDDSADRKGHVVTNQSSDEFHGWRLDKLQGFARENLALNSLYEKSNPVTPRQAQDDWKYVWFPNYVEFFHEARAQLVSVYQWDSEDGAPDNERWRYVATNGQKLAPVTPCAPPHQTWDQNAALYETVHRLSEDVQSQKMGVAIQAEFKITLAICIPFGQVVAEQERHAFALYVNLVFYSAPEAQEKLSKNDLIDASRLLHARLDSLRYIALQSLASEQVLTAENQSRELEARQIAYLNVMPEVKDINRIISSLQKKIQYVNAWIAPPSEGLMSAYSEVAPLFEQGYRVPMRHRDEILVAHAPADYSKPEHREADCAWVLGLAIERMLGSTESSRIQVAAQIERVPANGVVDIHLAKEYLASVLERLRRLKGPSIAKSIDQLTCFELEGQQRSLLASGMPDFATQIKFLQKFKSRYHEVLKFGRDDAPLTLAQLRPYLPISSSNDLDDSLWMRIGVPSHAPLIQFLSYFVGLHSSTSESAVAFFIKKRIDEAEQITIFKLEGIGQTHLMKKATDYNPEVIAKLLTELWMNYKQHGVPMSQTGYSRGDIVVPFVRLLESVPRACSFLASIEAGDLTLKVAAGETNSRTPQFLKIRLKPVEREVYFSNGKVIQGSK